MENKFEVMDYVLCIVFIIIWIVAFISWIYSVIVDNMTAMWISNLFMWVSVIGGRAFSKNTF